LHGDGFQRLGVLGAVSDRVWFESDRELVLQKAGAHKDSTAGGRYTARDTDPNNQQQPWCFTLLKLTPGGFVYDEKATQPNKDIFNCSPDNVVPLTRSYQ
jgi:hypothetical protein